MKRYNTMIIAGVLAGLLFVVANGMAQDGAQPIGRWEGALQVEGVRSVADVARAKMLLKAADDRARKGDTEAMLEALKEAERLAPDNAAVQTRVSQSYAMAGRARAAFEARKRAAALEPDKIENFEALYQLANWVGASSEAAAACRRVLELDPDNAKALLTLARATSWMGRLNRSVRIYHRYVTAHPDEAGPLLEWARVESWRGNFTKALRLVARFAAVGGEREVVRRTRARFLASADRPRTALELLEQEPAATWGFEEHFTRTVALYYARRYRDAVASLEKLRELRPDSRDVDGIADFVQAPLRSRVSASLRYYNDSDELEHTVAEGTARIEVSPATHVEAGIQANVLRADLGTGLEPTRRTRHIKYDQGWLGVHHALSPALEAYLRAGGGETEEDHDTAPYRVQLRSRPWDSLLLSATVDHDLLLISARTASLAIERTYGRVDAEWRPNLSVTVVGAVRYDDYTDGNERWWGVLAPRGTVLRSELVNLDLGARYVTFEFEKNLNNGYYEPEWYTQYAGTLFAYLKLSEQTGVSIIGVAGVYRDADFRDWEFGWSVDSEATLGAFSDWMLKLRYSIMENLRTSALDTFQAQAFGVSLTRRF